MKMQTDVGYAWVVVVAAFIIFVAATCFLSSFGILYISYSEAFLQSKATTGWIGSIQMFFFGVVGIFGGFLMEKLGAKRLCLVSTFFCATGSFLSAFSPNIYILYVCNILTGPSLGLLYLCSSVIVQQWFEKKRALAASLAMSGIPIGHTISGPLTVYLENKYTWRGTVIIFSGILLHCLIGCCLYKSPPIIKIKNKKWKSELESEMDAIQHGCNMNSDAKAEQNLDCPSSNRPNFCRNIIDFDVLKNKNFLLYNFLTCLGLVGPVVVRDHLPSRAVFFNVNQDLIGYFPFVFGLCQCIIRPLGGFLANLNLPYLPILRQYKLSYILNSIVICLIGFTGSSFTWMMVCCSCAGITEALFLSVDATLMTLIVGVDKVSHALGLHYATLSLILLVATPFAGWLFDITQNYNIPFFVCGGIQFFAGLILLCIKLPKKTEAHMDEMVVVVNTSRSLESLKNI